MYRVRDATTGATIGIAITTAQVLTMVARCNVSNYSVEVVPRKGEMQALSEYMLAFDFFKSLQPATVKRLADEFIIGEGDNGEPEFEFREGQVAEDQGDSAR